MQMLKKMTWTIIIFLSGVVSAACANIVYAEDQPEANDSLLVQNETGINQNTESNLIYNFKNAKKEGTITFIKKWKDRKDNESRAVPDIEISTAKPRQNANGYTIEFYGNGMTFPDGSDVNKMVFNSSMEIVSGQYKTPGNIAYAYWYTEPDCVNRVKVSKDGTPDLKLSEDIKLYAKAITFVLKPGYAFSKCIPDNVTSVIFTGEEMPSGVSTIDVDADGDYGVVAWVENNTMKVSTQIEEIKTVFNIDSAYMFDKKQQLQNITFHNIDTSNVTSMAYMFRECKSITSLDLTEFNTSKMIDMSSMFLNCTNLKTIKNNFDTSNVIYISSFAKNCNSLEELDTSGWDTSNITNMGDMFNACWKISLLDVSSFNTSKVGQMGYMFFNCSSLTSLDVSNWDTSNVSYFTGMFSGCSKLAELDVSGFKTAKAIGMTEFFYGCRSLTELDVSNFNTENVTSMNHMFGYCTNVQVLDVSKFNTSKVKYMNYMFANCWKISEFNVSSFDTSNVVNMEQMFYGCGNMKTLDLSSFYTPNITNICNMFNMCPNLESLDISNIDTSKVTNMNWTFSNLNSLKTLSLGKDFAFVGAAHGLRGMWMNSKDEEFDAMEIPNNVKETYTRIA